MKKSLSAGAVLLLSTSVAMAGGLDRSGQSVAAIFESGDYVELSFGSVTPSVTGVGPDATFLGTTDSGNVAPAYTIFGMGMRTQLSDNFALGLILDQPFGAHVDYAEPGYALYESAAEVNSTGITILGRYNVTDAIAIHAGPRIVSANGVYTANDPATGPGVDYTSTYSSDTAVGYVVGASYEIPDIALRAALTYSSALDMYLDGTAGDIDVALPQSVNLDFQTGIAADTLAFVNIRWADWTEAYITDTLVGNLVDYDNDTITYSAGVGRKFSDTFSGSITVGYEEAQGGAASNLSPTDGYLSLSVGGAYTLENGMKISGGIRYVDIGDATTETINASFTDNSALAIGLKISTSF
jgi:long-subunit fatty acid transport protein